VLALDHNIYIYLFIKGTKERECGEEIDEIDLILLTRAFNWRALKATKSNTATYWRRLQQRLKYIPSSLQGQDVVETNEGQ